jgi:FMS-like tyrosine kinase 1
LLDNPNVNDIRDLAGELKMIIHVGQHENIVNVLGACTKYPKLYMIIEYCSHGSLLEFLRRRREIFQPSWFKEDFTSKERLTIVNLVSTAIQVCNGMRFLASKKVTSLLIYYFLLAISLFTIR